MQIKAHFKQTLPNYLHTMKVKGKPLVWLPQERGLEFERFRTFGNDRHYMMTDYDVGFNERTGTYNPVVDYRHYDIEPNIVIYNPHCGSHQALWRLTNPVHCQIESKQRKPFRLLRAIEGAYDENYNCDDHFGRYISRNPFYISADTEWRHDRTHTLRQLAEPVDLNLKRVKAGSRKKGEKRRNGAVFDDLRFWAYKQDTANYTYDQWLQRCTTQALAYNCFEKPMALNEVQSIARSVAQYTFNRSFDESFTDYVKRTHTSEIQAKRGAIGGKKSKRGSVSDSERTTKPWLALGISRATYYRKKASD